MRFSLIFRKLTQKVKQKLFHYIQQNISILSNFPCSLNRIAIRRFRCSVFGNLHEQGQPGQSSADPSNYEPVGVIEGRGKSGGSLVVVGSVHCHAGRGKKACDWLIISIFNIKNFDWLNFLNFKFCELGWLT